MKQDAANSIAAMKTLPLWVRVTLSLALLLAAGFCAFGFLATFEPNPWWVAWPWRIGYALLGLGSLAGLARVFRKHRANPMN